MKEIELTKGYVALVDDEDYETVSQYKWYTVVIPESPLRYANTKLPGSGKTGLRTAMHRLLLDPGELMVDHIDGDGLNNQRSNLRLVTHAQNMLNRRKHSSNTSGYKGVYWEPERGKWRCQVKVGGRVTRVGRFDDLLEAALAYDRVAKELHGEFARLNFPEN